MAISYETARDGVRARVGQRGFVLSLACSCRVAGAKNKETVRRRSFIRDLIAIMQPSMLLALTYVDKQRSQDRRGRLASTSRMAAVAQPTRMQPRIGS